MFFFYLFYWSVVTSFPPHLVRSAYRKPLHSFGSRRRVFELHTAPGVALLNSSMTIPYSLIHYLGSFLRFYGTLEGGARLWTLVSDHDSHD